jgi:hypothetical protein
LLTATLRGAPRARGACCAVAAPFYLLRTGVQLLTLW